MAIGVPSVTPSNRPESTSTLSPSLRWVVIALCPGRRRSSSLWTTATSTAMPGGMPSTTTPTPGPCDSPKVVTTKRRPNEDDIRSALACRARWLGPSRRGALGRVLRLVRGDGARAEGTMGLDHPLELIEVRRAQVGASAGDPGRAAVPGDDVLAAGVEEQLGVEHTTVDEGGHHLPVRGRHAEVAILVVVRKVACLDLGPARGLERREEPGARASQL